MPLREIEIERDLSASGIVLCAPGDKVSYNQIIGKITYIPGAMHRIAAAAELGIAPDQLSDHMLWQQDEYVEPGAAICSISEFNYTKKVYSETGGFIAMWSDVLGCVYVREPVDVNESEIIQVNLGEYGVTKNEMRNALRVKEGQTVYRNQPVIKGRLIPLPLISEVIEISFDELFLKLKIKMPPLEVLSLVDGVVDYIDEYNTVHIVARGYQLECDIGYGGEDCGELYLMRESERNIVTGDLSDRLEGKIVVGQNSIEADALEQLAQRKIKGLVLGSLSLESLRSVCKSNPLIDYGMKASTPFPIILFQGFEGSIPATIYEELMLLDGQRCALFTDTQLRAHATRPKIVITPGVVEGEGVHDTEKEAMAVGVVKGEPYNGMEIETILSTETFQGESNTDVAVQFATVRLIGGRTVKVPLVNIKYYRL